jgi:oligosaccharide repeat unit polymerase
MLGAILLCLLSVGALVAFGLMRGADGASIGAGATLTVAALSAAFLLGLFGGDYRGIDHKSEVTLLFAVGLASFLVGAVAMFAMSRATDSDWPDERSETPLYLPAVSRSSTIIALLVAANLATGGVPLFSSNIDASRFAPHRGVVYMIFPWLIGALEAVTLLILVSWIARRDTHTSRLRLVIAIGLLVLIASRSIMFTVILAAVLAAATLGRISVKRLVLLGLAGAIILGGSGEYRIRHSDPTGSRQAFLKTHGYNGVTGIIAQSASSAPWVFGQVIDFMPSQIPFQHGGFVTRDFRAQLPLHPLGRPEGPDTWITTTILRKDPRVVGGEPPTLVGGLYIDFGVPGIMIGCLLLGVLMVALFNWARRTGTIGAAALYTYASAYMVLSAYNYVSLKPIMLAALGVCLYAHRVERRSHS